LNALITVYSDLTRSNNIKNGWCLLVPLYVPSETF